MPDQAPLVKTHQARVAAVAQGADATEMVAEAPFDGTVTDVSYTPDATITGAATNNRTVSLVNRKQDGTGAVTVATLSFGNGTNVAGGDEGELTLSGTPANLVVASGDEFAFVSTHVGSGIADPGGLVQVQVTRS